MKFKEKLSGVFAPITTPFDSEGEISYKNLENNMEFYSKSKLRGYLALGSNGENKSLSENEKEKILKSFRVKNILYGGCE